jgi:hypothetical protein
LFTISGTKKLRCCAYPQAPSYRCIRAFYRHQHSDQRSHLLQLQFRKLFIYPALYLTRQKTVIMSEIFFAAEAVYEVNA